MGGAPLELAAIIASIIGVLFSIGSLLSLFLASKRSHIEILRGVIRITIDLDDPDDAKTFLDEVAKSRTDGRGVIQ